MLVGTAYLVIEVKMSSHLLTLQIKYSKEKLHPCSNLNGKSTIQKNSKDLKGSVIP